MAGLMGDFKDLTKRRASEKKCVIMHLTLLIIQNMMDINEVLLQWFINVLIKNLLTAVLQTEYVRPAMN